MNDLSDLEQYMTLKCIGIFVSHYNNNNMGYFSRAILHKQLWRHLL